MIAIAKDFSQDAVTKREILQKDAIPESYLENLLATLRTKGLLYTKRGVGGGYALTRVPSQITLLEIVEALEGPLAPRDCILNHSVCKKSQNCFLRENWDAMYQAIRNTLGSVNLQQLVNKSREE